MPPTAATVPTPQRLRPNPAAIYPKATSGFGASSKQPPVIPAQDEAAQNSTDNKTKMIVILVSILGAYTALSALLGLLGSVTALSFGFIKAGGQLTVIDAIYLIIGVGLVFRKELARVVYIFLAIIGLLLTVYGTIHTFSPHSTAAISYERTQSTQYIAQDQQQIKNVQHNDLAPGLHLTSTQKQQQIQQLQKDIANTKKAEAKLSSVRLYAGLIQGYLLAIIPLVFLTRPSVKGVFE
jgi:hypothetical protein